MPSRPRPGTSDEIRRAFVEFFAERGHVHQPSSSLVPFNDPSVLLTTAGMQQMIPYMLGREVPPAIRMTSIQKCFRTGDIDEVGNPRNLTFFEMLGNFSIGDYFKESIIPWAWEFVTEWLQLPAERVCVTVHPTDDEARQIWLGIGFPAERITDLEENWWGPPGAEGPCGPDSELYYDWGPEVGCGRPDCAPGCECDRYLEFWNLVFMQFYQDRAGEPDAAAARQRRHRMRPGAAHGDHAAGPHRLRDGPVPADHRRGGRDRRHVVRAGRARRTTRCGSSRTTRAARPSWPRRRGARATRGAATSCAGSCGGRSATAASSGSSARSWRGSSAW